MSARTYIRYFLIAVLAVIALLLVIPIGMRIVVSGYTYDRADDVPVSTAALVLGASVRQGKPSPILEERAHAAVQLYMEGKVSKILVTGDNGELTYDEVTPVRKYLIEAGIPAKDIFLDHAGFDTYSSLYRARHIFQAESLVIVTQDFHLPRALYIARHLGITAYGLPASGSGSAWVYVREIPASAKAIIDIWTARLPRYLGDPIPLSGDGSTTWY